MKGRKDKKLEKIIKEFAVVHRWRLNRAASECGLYPGQPLLLFHLLSNQECTQKELADVLMVTPASVTVSVRRMEKAGYITRRSDSSDLRCNRLCLTEKGKKCADMCKEALDSINRSAYAGLSDEEKSNAERVLVKMIQSMKQV